MDEKTIARFWAKVNKTETCWLWTSQLRGGYGLFSLNGRPVSAHRLSYKMTYGEIPDGLLIRHSNECVSKACVNPDHLLTGTQYDNMQDRKEKGWHADGSPVKGPYQKKVGPRKVRKLSHQDVLDILKELEIPYWGQVKKLAEKYGVRNTTISNIKTGYFRPAHITSE